jgi:hypothetical protein
LHANSIYRFWGEVIFSNIDTVIEMVTLQKKNTPAPPDLRQDLEYSRNFGVSQDGVSQDHSIHA